MNVYTHSYVDIYIHIILHPDPQPNQPNNQSVNQTCESTYQPTTPITRARNSIINHRNQSPQPPRFDKASNIRRGSCRSVL